ncbi:DUF2470 domain-containing protein [Campylobacter suis]|uniref:DUF2470 domain-containing protein n=1 Tax=Campylobacter suis TaxID=2790657 RepID=A0ABN7K341_9BACT|nr:DUF2470 domain-containing protein [Campylobacter suis]CAD7286968.1 hypothetical protein LMG8286_00630 [Campylobacter suis]
MKEMVIEHMNENHQEILVEFAEKLGGIKDASDAKLVDVDEDGMNISAGGQSFYVKFLSKADNSNPMSYRDVVTELYASLS